MIQSASLFTFEIDDAEAALAEIRQQLDAKLVLRKNAAAILQCDPEFIESGTATHICEGLGFPVVGGTSAAQAVNGSQGDLMLSLHVFTSEDVEFVATHTDGLAEDLFGATAQSLAPAMAASPLPLRLILTFPPIIEEYAGDWYVEAFERVCGKVPVFGSLAVDDAVTVYDRCASVCEGQTFAREMSYLLVFGNVTPRFFVATVPAATTLPEMGVITKSQDNIVQEINGVRAIDFFERVDLAKNGVLRDGIDFVPFLMTVKNDSGAAQRPFVRALIRFDENGAAICRGAMYEGANFTIGSSSGADVIAATMALVEQINGQDAVGAALMFSCIVRRLTIGSDPQLELTRVRETLRDDIPFMLAYSGGEIAPTSRRQMDAENRFHNFSFIVCLL